MFGAVSIGNVSSEFGRDVMNPLPSTMASVGRSGEIFLSRTAAVWGFDKSIATASTNFRVRGRCVHIRRACPIQNHR